MEIREIAPQRVASKRLTIALTDIGAVMPRTIHEVYRHIEDSGATATGPPFARYWGWEAGSVDVEIGAPYEGELADGADGVRTGALPGGTVAYARHTGPYETLGQTYEELRRGLEAVGHQPSRPHWEVYLTDPADQPDPEKWETDVFWPIS